MKDCEDSIKCTPVICHKLLSANTKRTIIKILGSDQYKMDDCLRLTSLLKVSLWTQIMR